jgi:phosphoglycerate dehydrogenase-like enzyme
MIKLIVGLGNVGARLAAMAAAFGMEVFCYARTPKDLPYKQTQDLHTQFSHGSVVCAFVDVINMNVFISKNKIIFFIFLKF